MDEEKKKPRRKPVRKKKSTKKGKASKQSSTDTETRQGESEYDTERGIEAGLTPRQALFAERYARHGNATKAVREAGFSEKNSTHYAWELLRLPMYDHVRSYALMRRREIIEEMGFTPEKMIRQLINIVEDEASTKADFRERLGTVRNKLRAIGELERFTNWFETNVTKTENKHDLTGQVGVAVGGIGNDELLEIKSKISGLSKAEILEYERSTREVMGK